MAQTERNWGVSNATNEGYRHSKGKYIALLKDDDYWEDPKKIVKQLALMKNNSCLGLTGTWCVELGGNGTRVKGKPVLPRGRYFIKERMLMGGVIYGSTPLIARIDWEAVGGMDERQIKGVDSDLFRRIVLAGYDVEIVHELTTAVDVSHGMGRITPVESWAAKKSAINANLRVLRKHFVSYLLYPRALLIRAKNVFYFVIKPMEKFKQ